MSGILIPQAIDDKQNAEHKALAHKVLELTRSQIIATAPFLASATGILQPQIQQLPCAIATDGTTLWTNPEILLSNFARTRKLPTHEYAHTLLHCILLHPFVGEIEHTLWDLAADMVCWALCEEIFNKMHITPKTTTGLATSYSQIERDPSESERLEILRLVASELTGPLTTERIYHLLAHGQHKEKIARWSQLFLVDSHQVWRSSEKTSSQSQDSKQGNGKSTGDTGASSQLAQQTEQNTSAPDSSSHDAGDGHIPSQFQSSEMLSDIPSDAEKTWEHIAQQMRVDLETLSRNQGISLQTLIGSLEVSHHKRRDYREFLRQFAVESEDLRLSEDEFDYVFYTYGLELYGDMPLIEPLEYRQEHRVRDFAIVIDTSSSVTKKVVQDFIDATYDVLTTKGGFFKQACIHIIQADTRVQSDVRINNAADLARWRNHIELRGLGGTDFRPAIRYVQQLWQEGEFSNLRGLVYFTDGWGIYPRQAPPFKCAFVFYDEDHRPEIVPAWAEQLVLHPGEFESLSVYGKHRNTQVSHAAQGGTR